MEALGKGTPDEQVPYDAKSTHRLKQIKVHKTTLGT
jgi:hypothetical protein